MLCTAAIGVAGVTGCGGGDGDSTAKEGPRFSAATEPANAFIKRTTRLLATTTAAAQCQQLNAVNQRSYVRFSCPADKKLRRSMGDFKIVGWKEYGTGAVVDYRSGKIKDGAAILLFVAPDRNWGITRFGVVSPPSTKSDDEDSREDYENTVDDYLDAVLKRDCAAWQEVTFINPDTKPKDVCGKIFAATKDMAARMRANPDAEPTYEGGNRSFGFFSFDTIKPEESSTISVIKSGNSTVVMDVAPSPTARQRKAVIQQFRQQQKQGDKADQPERSKSRKAD